jgi:hypothetical protein
VNENNFKKNKNTLIIKKEIKKVLEIYTLKKYIYILNIYFKEIYLYIKYMKIIRSLLL